MRFSPDFSDSIDEFKPGNYVLRIKSCEERLGKKSGKPYAAWTLEIVGPVFNGVTVYHNTPLSGPGSVRLKAFLQAIAPEFNSGDFDSDDFIGKDVGARLEPGRLENGTSSLYARIVDVWRCTELGICSEAMAEHTNLTSELF